MKLEIEEVDLGTILTALQEWKYQLRDRCDHPNNARGTEKLLNEVCATEEKLAVVERRFRWGPVDDDEL
jgi:hypothetical protein